MTRALVLASTSPYRARLLERLDIPFTVAAPTLDERAHDDAFASTSDEAFATMLARGKADSLRAKWPTSFILAADQLAVLPGAGTRTRTRTRTLLHKPGSRDKAVEQLMQLAGRSHRLVTAIVVLDATTGQTWQDVDVVELTMRPFAREEAAAYVDAHAPLDCVGSYRIEDAGIWLFDAVTGADPTSIMGLPLLKVCRLLRAANVPALIPKR